MACGRHKGEIRHAGSALLFGPHGRSIRESMFSELLKTPRAALLAILTRLPVLLLVSVAIAAPAPSEYQVKAVFLFNFTQFVDWPAQSFADARAPFVIGVLGRDPFGSALDEAVRGETVNGR